MHTHFLPKSLLTRLEQRLLLWTDRYGMTLLRYSMGIVFFWFGALKPCGLSPATELVAQTTWWLPIGDFCLILGIWEMLIGICFIYKPLLRYALILLAFHMPGTMLPLVLLPDVAYVNFPFALTIEGQYIIKNLVLISAGLVLSGTLLAREKGLTHRQGLPATESYQPAAGLSAPVSAS